MAVGKIVSVFVAGMAIANGVRVINNGGRVGDEDFSESNGTSSSTECEDVDPSACMTLVSFQSMDQVCNKRYRGGLDDDPDARGARINAGACHSPSARFVPGRALYKYGPIAYAGGVVFGGKRYAGCCPATCGYCNEIMPAKPPPPPPPPTPMPFMPEPEPDPPLHTKLHMKPQTKIPLPPKPFIKEPDPEPSGEAFHPFIPEPDPFIPEPEPDPEEDPIGGGGEMWCREWQDMLGMAAEACADENGGKFFTNATSSTGSPKRLRSEEHRMKIDGWCCWPPMPRFSAGSGACTSIKCYYPDGNFCDQDRTCPKKYTVTGDAIKEAPGQLCSGKYPSRREEKARAKTC